MTTEHIARAYRQFSSCSLEIGAITEVATGLELTAARNTSPLFGPRTIDLTRSSGWSLARIEVTISLPEDEISTVVAEGEGARSLEVLAVLASSSSKFREAIKLQQVATGTWNGTVVVSRDRLLGVLQVGGRVCRGSGLGVSTPSRAAFAGAILCEADPVEVLLDEIERPYSGLVQFSWINFDDSTDNRFSSNKQSLLLVETDKAPTIFLNSAIDGFQAALESTQRKGSVAVARQTLALLVATQAMQAFLTAAISAIVYDDDSESCFVDAGWKGALAKRAARAIHSTLNEEEALKAIYHDWHDSSATDVLISQIASLSQLWSKGRGVVQKTIGAVDSTSE